MSNKIFFLLRRWNWHRSLTILAVVFLFFLGLSVLLSYLEKKSLIKTTRPDDAVANLRHDWLTQVDTPEGRFYKFNDDHMLSIRFSAEKGPDVFRIVATGESFMMGTPYVEQKKPTPGFGGIPDWLQKDLARLYPSRKFEVINAAAGAQNSDRVRRIAVGLAALKPDLLIVATGNNEGYLPFSPVNAFLQKWSVYRWLKASLLPTPALQDRPYYTPQDARTEKIEFNFQKNIKAIVEACEQNKVKLLLATLPINLKYAGRDPEVHGKSNAGPDEEIENGRLLEKKAGCAEALPVFEKSRDKGRAAYEIAVCREKMGQFDLAREFYKVHVQNVPKNRTRPSYNEFVRQLAREKNILLTDLESYTESISPNGLPDDSLFVDYCHMTRKAYRQMAQEIIRTLIKGDVIPGATDEPRADVLAGIESGRPDDSEMGIGSMFFK